MHEGEVVGLTGLLGSGFEEVPYLLYGARPARPGGCTIDGSLIELAAARSAAGDRAPAWR